MNTAIVLSGGRGSRMNSSIPKQYLKIAGKPLLFYSLDAFQQNDNIDNIIIVANEDYIDYIKTEIVNKYNISKVSTIVAGGSERYDSVYCGLKAITENAYCNSKTITENAYCNDKAISEDVCCRIEKITKNENKENYVFIHDGARPCISQQVINNCLRDVRISKACVAAVPVKDTIKVADNEGYSINTPDRKTLWQIQTPQVFSEELITNAYKKMYENDQTAGITDDAMVVERFTDNKVKMVKSDYKNIKVTTPEDLKIAEIFLLDK